MRTFVLSHSKQNGMSDTWTKEERDTRSRAIAGYVATHFSDRQWRLSRVHQRHIPNSGVTYAELTFVDQRDPPGAVCCRYPKGYVSVELV